MELEASLSSYDVESIAWSYTGRIRSGPADHALAIVMDDGFLYDADATSRLLTVRDNADIFSLARS